ncbi:MAG: amidase family protein [Alphaproteobacteria bacterium]
MPDIDPLIASPARALVERLRTGEITPHDLLDALAARIAAVDPAVNALPTLCLDRARARADALMAKPVEHRGPLAGLPVPIKDVTPVEGVRCTYGSPIFADNVAAASDLTVQRLEASGGLVYAKSNTPEFAAGAHTFNPVFGVTRTPWNTALSPAGSTGGGAAALASGMAWIAQGTDFGGSLRTPATFCGVVGLRPSPGRVAQGPGPSPFQSVSVSGPMARNVDDLALALDAMTGASARDPLSIESPLHRFSAATRAPEAPNRVAFSADLGLTPVDREIAAICRKAAEALARAGVDVDEAHPDLTGARDCFNAIRGAHFATAHSALLSSHRDQLKPDVVWNIEQGLKLSAGDLAGAERIRARLCAAMAAFEETYDLLIVPGAIVPPFPVEQRTVTECNGVTFETYVDWLAITYSLSLLGRPVLALPCGRTMDGLPVGLQLVGPHRGEALLLKWAAWIEATLDAGFGRPIDPIAAAA